jgi:hypothetical protein
MQSARRFPPPLDCRGIGRLLCCPARVGAAAAPTANVQSTLKRVLGQSEFQSPLFFVAALQRARAVAWLTSRNGDPRRTGLVRLSDFGLASAKDQMGILPTWQYGLGDSDDVGQAFFELAGFRTVLGSRCGDRLNGPVASSEHRYLPSKAFRLTLSLARSATPPSCN